jgi:hypothetical protein
MADKSIEVMNTGQIPQPGEEPKCENRIRTSDSTATRNLGNIARKMFRQTMEYKWIEEMSTIRRRMRQEPKLLRGIQMSHPKGSGNC